MSTSKKSISESNTGAHTGTAEHLDYLVEAALAIGFENPVKRIYQTQANQIFNDKLCRLDYVKSLADIGITCFRCGVNRHLIVRSRKRINKSTIRRKCRHLGQYIVENCANCGLQSRHTLDKHLVIASPAIKTTKQPKTPPKTTNSGKVGSSDFKAKKNPVVQQQKVNTVAAKSAEFIKPKASAKPQLSSRLRAFSCLLKE